MKIIEFIKSNSKEFLISCIVVTLGAFLIHARFNSPSDLASTIVYLPFIWFGIFIMMIGIGAIGGYD